MGDLEQSAAAVRFEERLHQLSRFKPRMIQVDTMPQVPRHSLDALRLWIISDMLADTAMAGFSNDPEQVLIEPLSHC